MNDLILILILLVLGGLALYSSIRKKKRGCGDGCSGCGDCGSSCGGCNGGDSSEGYCHARPHQNKETEV